jgi:hypothetical protein
MILNFDNLVQWVLHRCKSFDTWQKRKRVFDTQLVLFQLLQIVADLNSSAHATVLAGSAVSNYFPLLQTSASSFHAARYKVGWGILKKIFIGMIQLIDKHFAASYCWHGHRLFAIDGTKITLPPELKRAKYPRFSKKALYPMGLLTTLYRLKLNLPYDFILSRHANEIKNATKLIQRLRPSDIVIYDRYFISEDLLRTHWEKGIQFVFRCKTKKSYAEISAFAASKEKDTLVTFKRLGSVNQIRLVKYRIAGNIYILATSLLDQSKYPIHSLKALYHKRWGVEEFYKTLKKSLIIEQFHAKKPAGIKQELIAGFIHYVLARFLVLKAATRQKRRESQNKIKMALSLAAALVAPHFYSNSPIVRNRRSELALCLLARNSTPYRPSRQFQRISRKPINRWQYNSKTYGDRKKPTHKGVPP